MYDTSSRKKQVVTTITHSNTSYLPIISIGPAWKPPGNPAFLMSNNHDINPSKAKRQNTNTNTNSRLLLEYIRLGKKTSSTARTYRLGWAPSLLKCSLNTSQTLAHTIRPRLSMLKSATSTSFWREKILGCDMSPKISLDLRRRGTMK